MRYIRESVPEVARVFVDSAGEAAEERDGISPTRKLANPTTGEEAEDAAADGAADTAADEAAEVADKILNWRAETACSISLSSFCECSSAATPASSPATCARL